jgi:hypothetical protein
MEDRTKPNWLKRWGLPEYVGSDGVSGVGQREPFVTSDELSGQRLTTEAAQRTRAAAKAERVTHIRKPP